MASRRGWLWTGVVAFGSLVALARPNDARPARHLRATHPECPHTWAFDTVRFTSLDSSLIQGGGGGATSDYVFTTVGANIQTNIPEFNDCQRLILDDGVSYDRLAAVFAVADRSAGDRAHASAERALAAVEVWYEGRNYRALGLLPGFNCLFIVGDTLAMMVPLGRRDTLCRGLQNVTGMAGTTLRLRAASPFYVDAAGSTITMASADVPAVARWDWERSRRFQYIGFGCGTQWCEAGSPGFTPSAPFSVRPGTTPRPHVAATVLVKGWFDRQQLANYVPGAPLKAGKTWGTAFPDDSLGTYTIGGPPETTLNDRWRRAAHVAMSADDDGYRAKFNLASAPTPSPLTTPRLGLNTIELCRGTIVAGRGGGFTQGCPGVAASTRDACAKDMGILDAAGHLRPGSAGGGIWFARGTAVTGGPAKVKCVTYRSYHSYFPGSAPPTVRWRWRDMDEIFWISCPVGCCEVEMF